MESVNQLRLPEQNPQTVQLERQKFAPHRSGGQRSEMEVLAGLVSPEASLLGSWVDLLSCPRMAVSGCVCVLISS